MTEQPAVFSVFQANEGRGRHDPTVTIWEFLHSDRWTMPQASGRDQKDALWGTYTRHCGFDATKARPDDTSWTGVEIK